MSGIGRSDPPPDPTDDVRLDAERLDAYVLAVEFHGFVASLLPRRSYGMLHDQLERPSLSIVLNLAEGAGRVSPFDKARHYGIARGSAAECGAIVDVLRVHGIVSDGDARRARDLIVRIVQMSTGLLKRFGRSVGDSLDP